MDRNVLTLIDTLQQDIFTYRLADFSSNMLRLIEMLTVWAKAGFPSRQTALNVILKKALDSYEKKDYLLLADVLEFELKPLLTVGEDGLHNELL